MAPKLAKGMDPLGDISSDEGASSDSEGGAAGAPAAAPAPPKAKEVDFEALQKAGYRGGPSVLYIPEQRPAGEASWSWGRGTKGEAGPESASERDATRHAVGAGLDEAIAAQLRATEHANRLREEARQEAAELRQAARGGGAGRPQSDKDKEKDKLSFNAREKRKRERGQAIGGRNFVEEEKRIQRQYGVQSGFDN